MDFLNKLLYGVCHIDFRKLVFLTILLLFFLRAMLSGVIMIVVLICYCCHRNVRKHRPQEYSQYWRTEPDVHSLEVFTMDSHAMVSKLFEKDCSRKIYPFFHNFSKLSNFNPSTHFFLFYFSFYWLFPLPPISAKQVLVKLSSIRANYFFKLKFYLLAVKSKGENPHIL